MTMQEWIEEGKDVFMNNYRQLPVVFEKGEGCFLYDVEGKKYLDFVAGIAVNALGYNYKPLNEALKNQLDRFTHCSNLYYNKPSIEAARKLISATGLDKVFFCNSGAEANETALKLCRKYSKKTFGEDKFEIISMKNSFHGRTFATITATGQEKYQKGLSPLLPGIKYCEFNNIEDLKSKIGEHTCGILLEIIQGEGGIVAIDPQYLKEVRDLCDANNLVLIFDEIQTGIGRTGELFAYQNYGVLPDIITSAKGLGAGIPIGATIASKKVSKGFEPGDHATTFGGNPLACTAANVVLDTIVNGGLLEEIKSKGLYLRKKLLGLKDKKSNILEIRGQGLMQGIALENCNISDVLQGCMDKGLLLVGAGNNIIRFVPPLIISKEEIDMAVTILDSCLE